MDSDNFKAETVEDEPLEASVDHEQAQRGNEGKTNSLNSKKASGIGPGTQGNNQSQIS